MFFGISGIGWILDFSVYIFLNSQFKMPMVANIISATVGVSFVFWVSVRKTFAINNSGYKLSKKYAFYLVYQVMAISVASFLIGKIEGVLITINLEILFKYSYILAKILITPLTMIINFSVMKYLIEKI